MIQSVSIDLIHWKDASGSIHKFPIHLSLLRFHLPAPFRRHRFAGITPPGIRPIAENSPLRLLPVQLPAFFGQGIIHLACGKEQPGFGEFPVILTCLTHVGPDRNHEMHIHLMQAADHICRIRKPFFIKGFLSPQISLPAHPVQYQAV